MARNVRWDLEIIELLLRDLTRGRAHDEMDLVRRTINLRKQPLQIDCSASAGSSNHQFHCVLVISSEAGGEVEKSLTIICLATRLRLSRASSDSNG